MQEDTSANLIFAFGELIADLSRLMTLEPGDLILTGTPAGSQPVQPGDVVEVEIEGVGTLRNEIAEAETDLAPYGAMPKVSPQVARRRLQRAGRAARTSSRPRRATR